MICAKPVVPGNRLSPQTAPQSKRLLKWGATAAFGHRYPRRLSVTDDMARLVVGNDYEILLAA
jgi:hypothetical protein